MKHKKLFKEILDNIKDVEICNVFQSAPDLNNPNCPLCMIGNAIRNGIKVPEDTAYADEFAKFFDVSYQEAEDTLFPEIKDFNNKLQGNVYYLLGMKLLADHK